MKILYISTVFPRAESSATIYTDLAEALAECGHEVTVLAAEEKKKYRNDGPQTERGCRVFRVRIGNMYDVGLIEKGLSVITLSHYMKQGIRKHLAKEQFDLILFEAPPATMAATVAYAKKRYGAKAFLMMKDIFPQNAVDIGMMRKGLVYRYFCQKEKALYRVADEIGCMSEGNRSYIAEHSGISPEKLSIFPNTKKIGHIQPLSGFDMREKYGIPKDRVTFIFGGNMGKPQGLPFLCDAIKRLDGADEAYFVLVGRGTERAFVESSLRGCANVSVLDNLPRDEYERLVRESDVGIVSLDHRFTIPNYPSRVLSYLEYGMPVLAATDRNTDFKDLIREADCGFWCESRSFEDFADAVARLTSDAARRKEMGENGRRYMEEHFDVAVSVRLLENYHQKARS